MKGRGQLWYCCVAVLLSILCLSAQAKDTPSVALVKSGDCLQNVVEKVRSVWSKIKDLKFYYYNVGGMDVDSMINTLKRF